MSTSVLLSPAPGWYADPAGQAAYRWWDGDAWTAGTHDEEPQAESFAPMQLFAEPEPEPEPEPAPEPVAMFAPEAPLPPHPQYQFEPQPQPQATFPAQPAQHPSPQRSEEARRASRGAGPAKTRWSSMLFAYPFVYPFAVGMIVALAYAGGAASAPTALIVIGGIVAVALLIPAWLIAEQDRRELVARGYAPAPSLAWMALVPPIAYLIARRRVVGPSY